MRGHHTHQYTCHENLRPVPHLGFPLFLITPCGVGESRVFLSTFDGAPQTMRAGAFLCISNLLRMYGRVMTRKGIFSDICGSSRGYACLGREATYMATPMGEKLENTGTGNGSQPG